MQIAINLSALDATALSLVAIDPIEWIENLIAARCAAAMDEVQRSPDWPAALASAQAAGVAVQDAGAVLQHATAAGIIKTAAQRQAEMQSAPPLTPAPDPGPASVSRQQVARELLAREMVSPAEAVALAQTGMAPAWIADLIETLPAEQQALAYIALTEPVWRRNNGVLAALSGLPGAPEIDLDDFFAAAALR